RQYEMIEFVNFGGETYRFDASLSFYGDFKDIFEIRGMKREKRGETFEILHVAPNKLRIGYIGTDRVERFTTVLLCRIPDGWDGENTAIFEISLQPHQHYMLEYSLAFGVGKDERIIYNFSQARKKMEEELHLSRKEFAHVY